MLLSHYHGDHFDQEIEAQLRRLLPIITTPHAKKHLVHKEGGEAFTDVYALDAFEGMVTGTPDRHIPTNVLDTLNDIAHAVCISF